MFDAIIVGPCGVWVDSDGNTNNKAQLAIDYGVPYCLLGSSYNLVPNPNVISVRSTIPDQATLDLIAADSTYLIILAEAI